MSEQVAVQCVKQGFPRTLWPLRRSEHDLVNELWDSKYSLCCRFTIYTLMHDHHLCPLNVLGHGCGGWPSAPLPPASLQQWWGHPWHGHTGPFQWGLQSVTPALQLWPPAFPWRKPLFCRGNKQRCAITLWQIVSVFIKLKEGTTVFRVPLHTLCGIKPFLSGAVSNL